MNIKIIYKKNDIKKFISNLINQNKSLNIKVERDVEKIFKNIQARGDKALFDYAKKFDKCKLNEKNIVINKNKIKVFAKKCPKDIANALFFSASRIKKFHLHQIPKNYKYKDNKGFMKKYSESIDILKNKMLYDLSSYNNYFIFQRK